MSGGVVRRTREPAHARDPSMEFTRSSHAGEIVRWRALNGFEAWQFFAANVLGVILGDQQIAWS